MGKLNKNILFGILITLSGSLLYVLMSLLSKLTRQHLNTNHIVFMQSITGLLCACVFIKFKKYNWRQIIHQHRFAYFGRISMSLTSIYLLIYGLQYVSIFNALVVLNSSPLIIPLLRRIFFNKKIHFLVFPTTLSAFAGIILILSPDSHILESPIIIMMASMFCMAISLIILEKSQNNDPDLAIFYYFLYSSIITTLLAFQNEIISTPGFYFYLSILIGILFFFVQLSVVYAANYISSHLISVLFYSEIILSLFVSVLFENLQLNTYLIIGTLLVILGGIGTTWIEHHQK